MAELEALKQQAAQGNADAQFALGCRLATGQDIEQNRARAAAWQRKPRGITVMRVGGAVNEFANLEISESQS